MPSYIMYIKVERNKDGNTIEHKSIDATTALTRKYMADGVRFAPTVKSQLLSN